MRDRPRAHGAAEAPAPRRAVDGLAPIFVERIFETVVEVNKQGTPVLLVEQNALMALDVAQRGYVMETGRIAPRGPRRSELKTNEQVRKTYLGEG